MRIRHIPANIKGTAEIINLIKDLPIEILIILYHILINKTINIILGKWNMKLLGSSGSTR